MRSALLGALLLACCFTSAHAGNAACWGDDSRTDITCVKITEPLLLSMRGKAMDDVRKIMRAPGANRQANGLHYLSNFANGGDGSGYVNVLFDNGKAVAISAEVSFKNGDDNRNFIWSAYQAPSLKDEFDKSTMLVSRAPYCSDLSKRYQRCLSDTIDDNLMTSRMQFNSSRAETLQMLEAACHPKGIAVSDPNGDCDRLRDILQ